MNFKCNCPYCNQTLEAESDMFGMVIDCPGCATKILVTKNRVSPSSLKLTKPDASDTEPATEKQIAFISRLGGTASSKLKKFQASRYIEGLLAIAPATKRQLDGLKKEGVPIPCDITENIAKEMQEKVKGDKPPSKSMIDSLVEFGVLTPPKTTGEAKTLYDNLISTSKSTLRQKLEAVKMGGDLPEGLTYLQANEYISSLEQDRDPEDGKPPTKEQLKQIKALGGDVSKAINNWRAETYIEQLEELAEEEDELKHQTEQEENIRIECAYELGKNLYDKWDLDVKRPSKTIMKKAIQYGIDQGWGQNWDDIGLDENIYHPCSLIAYAIYCVAPELLKPDKKPPQMPLPHKETRKQSSMTLKKGSIKASNNTHLPNSSKGKGCMIPIMFFMALLLAGSLIKYVA